MDLVIRRDLVSHYCNSADLDNSDLNSISLNLIDFSRLGFPRRHNANRCCIQGSALFPTGKNS